LSNENQLIIEKNKEIEVNNTVASTSKSKLNELVPGKSKRAKKEEKLIFILTTNKRGHPNSNEKIKEGVLVESNRWDEGLRNFIQNMEQETRWDITKIYNSCSTLLLYLYNDIYASRFNSYISKKWT
jgi:hypothetical protein